MLTKTWAATTEKVRKPVTEKTLEEVCIPPSSSSSHWSGMTTEKSSNWQSFGGLESVLLIGATHLCISFSVPFSCEFFVLKILLNLLLMKLSEIATHSAIVSPLSIKPLSLSSLEFTLYCEPDCCMRHCVLKLKFTVTLQDASSILLPSLTIWNIRPMP